jgi:hypothetical protein
LRIKKDELNEYFQALYEGLCYFYRPYIKLLTIFKVERLKCARNDGATWSLAMCKEFWWGNLLEKGQTLLLRMIFGTGLKFVCKWLRKLSSGVLRYKWC